jgi:hypothetical protein
MAIEFHCPHCNRQIRTPDEHAGKRGKCPQCQAVVEIPAASAAPDELDPLGGGLNDPWGDLPPPGAMPQTPFPGAAANSAGPAGWGAPPAGTNPYAAPAFQPPPRPASSMSDDRSLRWILPIGHSPFAIAAGYLGLFSLACCPLGPLAVILAIAGIIQMQKNPRLSGMGRCIVGIVLGAIGTLGLLFILFAMLVGKR